MSSLISVDIAQNSMVGQWLDSKDSECWNFNSTISLHFPHSYVGR